MTHDELVAEIKSLNDSCSVVDKVATALRAVVELHKPKSSEYFEGDVCETCSWDLDYYTPYPCPTIQAIEKELA